MATISLKYDLATHIILQFRFKWFKATAHNPKAGHDPPVKTALRPTFSDVGSDQNCAKKKQSQQLLNFLNTDA